MSCVNVASKAWCVRVFPEKFPLISVIQVFHPVKCLLAIGIIQPVLVCIASNVVAIRTVNKICSYWYNLPPFFFFLPTVDRNIFCYSSRAAFKNKSFLWINAICQKSPPVQAGCVSPWYAECCVASAGVNCILPQASVHLWKEKIRAGQPTWSQVVKKSILLTWDTDRTFCIWCVKSCLIELESFIQSKSW